MLPHGVVLQSAPEGCHASLTQAAAAARRPPELFCGHRHQAGSEDNRAISNLATGAATGGLPDGEGRAAIAQLCMSHGTESTAHLLPNKASDERGSPPPG